MTSEGRRHRTCPVSELSCGRKNLQVGEPQPVSSLEQDAGLVGRSVQAFWHSQEVLEPSRTFWNARPVGEARGQGEVRRIICEGDAEFGTYLPMGGLVGGHRQQPCGHTWKAMPLRGAKVTDSEANFLRGVTGSEPCCLFFPAP